jgi:uncharacterized membrane protein YdjX (TVP38/TMEM64 family)
LTSNPPIEAEAQEGEVEVAKESNNKLQTWLVIIATLLVSAGFVLYISRNEEGVKTFIRDAGILGPLVSIVLFAILGLSPIPSEIIVIIVGAVYGGLNGTLISWSGNMVAAIIEYYVGGHIARMADFEERRQHMPLGLGRFPANSPLFLIAARIVPGYGPKMVGIVGGMYKVPLWRYIWTAAIPTAIGAAFFAFGGEGLMKTLWGH